MTTVKIVNAEDNIEYIIDNKGYTKEDLNDLNRLASGRSIDILQRSLTVNRIEKMIKWIKEDENVAWMALCSAPNNHKHIDKKLLNDMNFAKKVVFKSPERIQYFSNNIRCNPEFALELLSHFLTQVECDGFIDYMKGAVLSSKKVAKAYLNKTNGESLFRKFSAEVRADYEIASIAVKKYPWALEKVSQELQAMPRLVKTVIKKDVSASLNCMDPELWFNKGILLSCFSANCLSLAEEFFYKKKDEDWQELVTKAETILRNALVTEDTTFFIKALKNINYEEKDTSNKILPSYKTVFAFDALADGLINLPEDQKISLLSELKSQTLKDAIYKRWNDKRLLEITQENDIKQEIQSKKKRTLTFGF